MRSIEDNSGGQQSGGGETCEQVIKYLGNCGQKTLSSLLAVALPTTDK